MTPLESTFPDRLVVMPDGRPGLRTAMQVEVRDPSPAAGSDSQLSTLNSQPVLDSQPSTLNSQPVLDFVASDATLDRYGEIISPAGWHLDNYLRNPVFQNAHQHGDIIHTLGRALITELRSDTREAPVSLSTINSQPSSYLFQRIQFATDANPIARIAYALYKGHFLNAVSVGFIPLRWEDPADSQVGRASQAPLPANSLSLTPGFNPVPGPLSLTPGFNPVPATLSLTPGFNPVSGPLSLTPGFNPVPGPLPLTPGFNPVSGPLSLTPGFNPVPGATPGSPNCFNSFPAPALSTLNSQPSTRFSRRYLEQELLEVSAVAIPANPNALTLALKSGALEKSDLRDTLDLLRSLLATLSPASQPPPYGVRRQSSPPGAGSMTFSSVQSGDGAFPTPTNPPIQQSTNPSLLAFARTLRDILSRT